MVGPSGVVPPQITRGLRNLPVWQTARCDRRDRGLLDHRGGESPAAWLRLCRVEASCQRPVRVVAPGAVFVLARRNDHGRGCRFRCQSDQDELRNPWQHPPPPSHAFVPSGTRRPFYAGTINPRAAAFRRNELDLKRLKLAVVEALGTDDEPAPSNLRQHRSQKLVTMGRCSALVGRDGNRSGSSVGTAGPRRRQGRLRLPSRRVPGPYRRLCFGHLGDPERARDAAQDPSSPPSGPSKACESLRPSLPGCSSWPGPPAVVSETVGRRNCRPT